MPDFKTILQRILFFNRFFLANSTIHGLNHIFDKKRHYTERFFWFVLVLLSTYWVAKLSNQALMRYVDNPTVISMERDYFSWNTSFPTATICPSNKINITLLEDYVIKSKADNKTALKEFLKSLAEAGYDNFDRVVDCDEIKPDAYIKVLLDVQVDFEPTVTCPDGVLCELERTVTEMGICYSFNSHMAIYNSVEYRDSGSWSLMKEKSALLVNPLDGDVYVNVVNIPGAYEFYVHGPYEVPDVTTKAFKVENGHYAQAYFSALSIFSTSRVKRLMPRQRKCKYYDESHLSHSPVYSYVLCRIECRIKLAKQLCGCLPHFYRKLAGEKICDVKGLHCLSKYSERLKTLKKECNCFSNCDDVNYVAEELDIRLWFLGGNLQFGLKNCPKMRLKRDLIFGFTDVLVYIGGLAGLFLGCSVLSFIEIFYLFTFRLFWFITKKNNKIENN